MSPILRPVEWVSFEDADGDTWQFDVSFLASSWTCIYGKGCQGILTGPTPELEQGCCSYGAHFISDEDRETVLAATQRLNAEQWQFKSVADVTGGAFETNEDGDLVTRLTEDACIFLNRPDFPAGAGCALHVGALAAGERPLDWKPDVCWQVPLRYEELADDKGHKIFVVREWKRRDWGEGGAEFHWWCTDDRAAFVGSVPVYVELRDELIELVGEEPYELLADYLEGRGHRRPTPLPHPIVRRKRTQGASESGR